MTTASNARTIRSFQDQRRPFAVDALAPSRFGFLEVFPHIRDVCRTFFFTEDMPCCAVALGIPASSASNSVILRIPVFEVHKRFKEDVVAQRNMKLSRSGRLCFGLSKCSVGAFLKYCEAGPGAFRPGLSDYLAKRISESRPEPWVIFPKPKEALRQAFKPSFIGAQIKYTYVHPIVLDGKQIFGAFGLDLMEEPTPRQKERLLLLLGNFEHILSGLYRSYYTHLDAPPKDVAKAMGGDWPWESAARVLDRAYLDELKGRAVQDGECPVGKTKNCLIVYGDGNGIKHLDDTYGHEIGNEVIRALGAVLWKSSRETCLGSRNCKDAVVVRWGGDEFIVVMGLRAGQKGEEVVSIFTGHVKENLRAAVKALERVLGRTGRYGLGLQKYVGISIGWSAWNIAQGEIFDKPRGTAERAMYMSKGIGKLFGELSKVYSEWREGTGQNVWVTPSDDVGRRRELLRELIGGDRRRRR